MTPTEAELVRRYVHGARMALAGDPDVSDVAVADGLLVELLDAVDELVAE